MFLVSVFRDSLRGTGISDREKKKHEGGYQRGSALEDGPTFTAW